MEVVKRLIQQVAIINANETQHNVEFQVNLKIAQLIADKFEVLKVDTNDKFITIVYNKWVEYEKETTYKIH